MSDSRTCIDDCKMLCKCHLWVGFCSRPEDTQRMKTIWTCFTSYYEAVQYPSSTTAVSTVMIKLNAGFEVMKQINIKKKRKLWIFTFIFRSLNARYVGPTVYKGIKGNKYSADFGDVSNDLDLKCFCTTPKSCLKRGVHDLTRCTGKSCSQER
jgi:hypothetical protein